MGLFWKRTKPPTPTETSKPAVEPTQLQQPAATEAEQPPQSAPTEVEKKPGFFQRLFGQQQAASTTRPVEQEKASLWSKIIGKESNKETPLPVSSEISDSEKISLFQRWKSSLNRTSENLLGRLEDVIHGKKVIDQEVLDSLEEALIGADIGVQTSLEIIEIARQKVDRKEINNFDELKRIIKDELLKILTAPNRTGVASETDISPDIKPYVMMIVGVNGVGKTTTIGKLASRIKAEGNDVLICAADTFRAAATDQLAIWAERTQVPLIQQKKGTDPAAVLYDALMAAKARNADVLIVDTAGRLHNKANLMAELDKMKRIAAREVAGAPHEVLLIIDAITGQNGLEQARQFLKVVPVTGLVLTKLDGTAKGGIVVAICKELRIPIRYVGIGEGIDDLVVFSPEDYVNGLFD
ncbi:MAG: signal recognition particle-docking protein FtsY [Acidobacteriota bacterium]|nr:signal recognition particle-docking protein FtsY [Blastocatellia bacterium]MDW8411593.1 signal recognition particle-docking protein FtsY [Acidobacteriota bacterium]